MRLLATLALFAASLTAAQNLELYFIDVEGGKAVLAVSPSGQSMLYDAGWPIPAHNSISNDRILEAIQAAGVKRIDLLVISHFDIDHIGDVTKLAARIPIGHIYDHGDLPAPEGYDPGAGQRFSSYRTIRERIGHTTLKPGDKVPFDGVDVQVLSSAGKLITKPLPGAGAPNPLCATYKHAAALPTDAEDDRSLGLLFTFGAFRMLDLADLEAHPTHDLVCPNNLIGTVDVYNVNVHGQYKGIAPELAGAVQASVMIQANGESKGADAKTWPILKATPGLKDIWQLHYSLAGGKTGNPPDDFIANPDGANPDRNDGFKWIRISASSDGSFTVTNSRNKFSKQYKKDPKQIVLANDKLEITVATAGSKLSKVVLKPGPGINPLASLGHFLALDGFGAPSQQEQALGMPFHGEASHQQFKILASDDSHRVTMQAFLPLAQETFTRTLEILDGENVVYVTGELESALTVDRPISWAEHATIGPPFMDPGKVVVDMSATNCRVRPYKSGDIPGHLAYDKDFTWPMAPTTDGRHADIREIPTDHNWLDLASCEMDPTRRLAFVTALNTEKHLLYGYVFRREDYPWVMSWMNFTGDRRAARGMEFSTQPFDISHRDTVAMSPLFGVPSFRWLPAKSKIEGRFLIFYTEVPDGFTKIDDVTVKDGKLTIVDHSGKTAILIATHEL
jgi:beta-lactamase superfamily II metal-dependent hydrolase